MDLKLNEKQLDALINIASKKLGTSPQILKSEMQKGTFDKALGNMQKNDAERLKMALSNPMVAEKILSTPQAKELFKKLTDK